MNLYLSSFRLGNHPEELAHLFSANKKIAVISNAKDAFAPDVQATRLQQEFDDLQKIGLLPEELDLRDFFDKHHELEEKINKYAGVWVVGGNVFILRRAMAQSGFDKIVIEKKKDKDFVYAGYSAGICVLSPTLKGLELVDSPNDIPEKYKPEIIWDGLGVINYSIAPHYQSEHPESASVEKEVDFFLQNNIPYKTLSDGEVIKEYLN